MNTDREHSQSRRRMSLLIPVNLIMIAAAATIVLTSAPQEAFLPLFIVGGLINVTLVRDVMKVDFSPAVEPARRNIEAFLRFDRNRQGTIRDETTGLCTRWYLEYRLDEEAARCRRYNHSMSVVVLRTGILDLASFSTDEWQVRSTEAARRAASIVRNVDLSAALTPFEFAICLVHCDRAGAQRAVERLTMELSDYNCEAGISIYPDDGLDPSAMIEVARTRMMPWPYEAPSISRREAEEADAA